MSNGEYITQKADEYWSGVSALFTNHSNTEQDLFKTIFDYGFRRGVYEGENIVKMTIEEKYGGELNDPTNN